jgi:hypothetical protein
MNIQTFCAQCHVEFHIAYTQLLYSENHHQSDQLDQSEFLQVEFVDGDCFHTVVIYHHQFHAHEAMVSSVHFINDKLLLVIDMQLFVVLY